MSVQDYQDIVRNLEIENDNLRYRLNVSTATNYKDLYDQVVVERDQLEDRIAYLEEEIIFLRSSPSHGSSPAFGGVSKETIEAWKRKVEQADSDILARDTLIQEYQVTVEALQQHLNTAGGDTRCHGNCVAARDLNDRLIKADDIILDMERKAAELEELYSGIVEKYNAQLNVNDQLAEKLTSTEFELYTTADRLDHMINNKDPSPVMFSVYTMTDGAAETLTVLRLKEEIETLRERDESAQYRISELSVENSELESTAQALQHKVISYKKSLKESGKRCASPVPQQSQLSQQSSQLAQKLEECQKERYRREQELLVKIKTLEEENKLLEGRIQNYEDEMFELTEKLSQVDDGEALEQGDVFKEISRRLSHFQLQQECIKKSASTDLLQQTSGKPAGNG